MSNVRQACIDCGLCDRLCPMNIKVSSSSFVNSSECINCLDCVVNCPKKGALSVESRYRSTNGKLPVWTPAALALVVFFGSYGIARATDLWKISGGRLVATQTAETAGAAETSETASYPPVDQIKGSNTLADVVKIYRIPKQDLYKSAGIPDSVPEATKIKDVKVVGGLTEFETEELREVVASILKARGGK